MHMEPGVVDGAKIVLSYATAGAAGLAALKLMADEARRDGLLPLVGRAGVTTGLVLVYFQLLPHVPVGVSEVHLIMATSLMLLFGPGSAAFGLAAGLLVQGVFFAPFDLPQYGMNITTLLVPLLAAALLAERIIPARTAYADLSYSHVLRLSATYQAGIVAWVAFWSFYGEGLTAATLRDVSTFGLAYLAVILVEPVVDLAVLALAKQARGRDLALLVPRVTQPLAPSLAQSGLA